MRLKRIIAVLLLVLLGNAYAGKVSNKIHSVYYRKSPLSDSAQLRRYLSKASASKHTADNLFAGSCYDINWATWTSFDNVTSTTGTIIDADGSQIGITMSANYTFGSTPSIYNYSRYNNYPSSILIQRCQKLPGVLVWVVSQRRAFRKK